LRDRRRRRGRSAFALALALILGACTTIDEHTAPPADWPQLAIHVERVAHAKMRDECSPFTHWTMSPEACALIYLAERRCRIILSAEYGTHEHERHEYLHCQGHDHIGSTYLADLWRRQRAAEAGEAVARALSRRP